MGVYQTTFEILIHVTLIATFEILLYFLYISKVEKTATDKQVSCLLPKSLINAGGTGTGGGLKISLTTQEIEEIEKELEKEGVKITSGTGIDKELKKIDKLNQLIVYLTGLTHKKAVKSKEERDKHNSTLHWYGVIIILFLMFLAVSWYYIGPMIIKQKGYKINFTHIITSVGLIILFIGIFEIFFVETIVLQYAVTSSQETQDILMRTLDGEDICQN